jgi:hypothetical protein
MALATAHHDSAAPGTYADGAPLSARLDVAAGALGSVLADLAPDRLLGADAAALYAALSHLERLVDAGKALLAPRIATSGHWEATGHRSPASLLASLEGGTTGDAQRTLETGRRLAGLPGVEQAARSGRLSGAKVAAITGAASVDPSAEGHLLAGAEDGSLLEVRSRCRTVRSTAAARDPLAAERRIHARRTFAWWHDDEGAFCFQGRDTAERGAALLARLLPAAERIDRQRRAGGGDGAPRGGGDRPPPEPAAALRADALFALVAGAADDLPGSPDDVVRGAPSATVIVRVDLEALRRGGTLPGERCDIAGLGPVPVATARHLLDDAFLAIVFAEAGDIRAVSHRGRTVRKSLRTALVERDAGTCVVPGCGATRTLEIDHVVPLEQGGPTELGNLALLCRHHHRRKTYDGWTLERTGPSDAEPGWRFLPLPPFGQEPDLGLDAPRNDPLTT